MKNPHWLDEHIEQQKTNTEILLQVCHPHTPAELQEIVDILESNGE